MKAQHIAVFDDVGDGVGVQLLLPSFSLIERQTELLDSGDDHLVGVIVGKQAAHQRFGVGVFLHATFLELVEFLAGLPVEDLCDPPRTDICQCLSCL